MFHAGGGRAHTHARYGVHASPRGGTALSFPLGWAAGVDMATLRRAGRNRDMSPLSSEPMKCDVDTASVSLHARADAPQRASIGWVRRQLHLLAIAWRCARLRALADRIETLATTAARRYELVAVEADGLDLVVASLRVRAVQLAIHSRAGLLDCGDASTDAGTNASRDASTQAGIE